MPCSCDRHRNRDRPCHPRRPCTSSPCTRSRFPLTRPPFSLPPPLPPFPPANGLPQLLDQRGRVWWKLELMGAAQGRSSVDTLARWGYGRVVFHSLCFTRRLLTIRADGDGACGCNSPCGNGLPRNTDENLTTAAHVSATAADVRSAAAAGLCAAGLCSSTTVRSTATHAVVLQWLHSGAHC